ncbi:MAG TPA: endonuclease/exonuclease/phosphatase family protein [Myxococcota bacterium]|jgi:endonuclease/exonuclease/phosphatase family metal-dependent hydrolase
MARFLVLAVLMSGGCSSGRLSESDAGVLAPPDDGTVDPIGSNASLDVGAWNLKNFPCGNASDSSTCRTGSDGTPALDASLMQALAPDLLSVEEIDSEDAFNQVVSLWPGRTGILSTHTYFDGSYQKVGFIYDSAVLVADNSALLFEDDDSFPRPPLEVHFTWTGAGAPLHFVAIVVHLKAGEEAADIARRGASFVTLEQHLEDLARNDDENVIVMGDFNETLTSTSGLENFAPFLGNAAYDVRTAEIAENGAVSFLPSGVELDHIITTAPFASAIGARQAEIPPLDHDVSDYLGRVSDHLPVFLSIASP